MCFYFPWYRYKHKIMGLLNDNKVYLFCLLAVILVILYFFVTYQTKQVLKHELKKMSEKKHKKQKLLQMRQQKLMQMRQMQEKRQHNHDMDSYIDPSERYGMQREEEEHHEGGYERARLSKDDILQRDFIDGTR